jgi:hypothetical protein
MSNITTIDCSHLGTRTNFKAYINLISTATGSNFSLASDCKSEICASLWGLGNPDISGIGMTISYCMNVVIGVVLTSIFLVLSTRSIPVSTYWKNMLSKVFTAYHDSAVLLAFSIQIASVVMLVKVNFGISAESMGANTVEVTWIVSLLTLLPLSFGIFVFRKRDEQKLLQIDDHTTQMASKENKKKDKSAKVRRKDGLRFMLFVISWMISAYPFFSRMVCTFGRFRWLEILCCSYTN